MKLYLWNKKLKCLGCGNALKDKEFKFSKESIKCFSIWEFKWDENHQANIYKTRKYIYRIAFNTSKHCDFFAIYRMLFAIPNNIYWNQCEDIGLIKLEMDNGTFWFE